MTGRRALIEGAVLLSCGLIGLVDGLRLIYFKNRASVEDFTGPGRYLFVVALLMAVLGAVYMMVARSEPAAAPAEPAKSRELTHSILATVAVLGLYILLIDLIGYFWSTQVFFLLILRVVGMPFSIRTTIIGVAMGLGFYLLFVRLFGMSFPHGRIFS
jgi:hypothetical protein